MLTALNLHWCALIEKLNWNTVYKKVVWHRVLKHQFLSLYENKLCIYVYPLTCNVVWQITYQGLEYWIASACYFSFNTLYLLDCCLFKFSCFRTSILGWPRWEGTKGRRRIKRITWFRSKNKKTLKLLNKYDWIYFFYRCL